MRAFLLQDRLRAESRTWRRLPFSQNSMTIRNCGRGPAGGHMVSRCVPGLLGLVS